MRGFALAVGCFLSSLAFACRSSPPDDWGYRYLTSLDSGGPAFNWRDIGAVGQHLPMLDDDNEGPLGLGFPFPFYGQTYESVFVCSNGWLSFASASHQYHHFPVPSTRDPNALLAPFWTDLDPEQGGSLFVHEDTGSFTVSWQGVPHRRGSEGFSFQAIIQADSSVLFQYMAMPDSIHADSSSVGIENETGRIGLSYFFDGAPLGALGESLAVRFFTVSHDVNPLAIHSPLEMHATGVPCAPAVSVKNYGTSSESPTVTCTVMDSASLSVLFADTVVVPSMDPADTSVVIFREWTPDQGTRLVRFTAELGVSDDSSLDTLKRYVRVSDHAYLAHDDGIPDGWYIVSGSPVSIMGLAVRFDPPYAPYHAVCGKIFVSNTLPFEDVFLSPDDGTGVPDLANPYSVLRGVSGASETAWAEAEFDVTVRSGDPVWLAAIWPRGAVGPLVGEDLTRPVDSCSYYTVYPPMWILRTSGDWLMRIEIDGNVGIDERVQEAAARASLVECEPNPFSSLVEMRLGFPQGMRARARLSISDASGRVVRSFCLDPDRDSLLRWDGTDSSGRRLPSGVYFVKPGWAPARKLVLVRQP